MISDHKSGSIVCGSSENGSPAGFTPPIRRETGTRGRAELSAAPCAMRDRTTQTLDKSVPTFWVTTLQPCTEKSILMIQGELAFCARRLMES